MQVPIVFRKIWRALFSCNACFEIRPFALLQTNYLEVVRLAHISSQAFTAETVT